MLAFFMLLIFSIFQIRGQKRDVKFLVFMSVQTIVLGLFFSVLTVFVLYGEVDYIATRATPIWTLHVDCVACALLPVPHYMLASFYFKPSYMISRLRKDKGTFSETYDRTRRILIAFDIVFYLIAVVLSVCIILFEEKYAFPIALNSITLG